MKAAWLRFKPVGRWLILGAVLWFLAKTFQTHWQEVAKIRVDAAGYACLAIALGLTLLAHFCAGWVWSWILQTLNQPVAGVWGAAVYLKTNIAKYLPGNLWHFYGRISAATKAGVPVEAATVSILLEPLLMVAAALLIALVSIRQVGAAQGWRIQLLAIAALLLVLSSLHPRCLNLVVARLGNLKQKSTGSLTSSTPRIKRYPWQSLLGEIGFLLLRGVGFAFTFLAIAPVAFDQVPILLGSFAIAWLIGFVTPGLPGGVGVFEATAIALLQQSFSTSTVLSVVALYRLVNTLAEAMGAGLVTLDDRA